MEGEQIYLPLMDYLKAQKEYWFREMARPGWVNLKN